MMISSKEEVSNNKSKNFFISLQSTEEKPKEKSSEEDKGETFGSKVKHVGDVIKDEFNKDVDKLAEVTHMKPW
jgi:hypothetical protein